MNPIKLIILAVLLFAISLSALIVYAGVKHEKYNMFVPSIVLSFLIAVFFIVYNF